MKLLIFVGSLIGLMINSLMALDYFQPSGSYPTGQLVALFTLIALLAIAER